MEYQFPVIVI